jgi:GT2 family glycosyltransferase
MFSIIVPVRNNPVELRQCLRAIGASTFQSYEVIVADDASTDTTPAVASEHGAVVLRMPQRGGPGVARNRAAEAAKGEYLLFLDSDVCIAPTTLERFAAKFAERPDLAAAFGSYDSEPPASNIVSQYKNLLHHQMHQTGSPNARTFWSGCGAIRRSVFHRVGGFDVRYDRPCVEDIELGTRLCRHGYHIALCKDIQVAHLKKWTMWSVIKTDIVHRAIPWSQLIVREGSIPNDLNLRMSQRLSSVAAIVLSGVTVVLCALAPAMLVILGIGGLGLLLLDRLSRSRPIPSAVLSVVPLAMIALATLATQQVGVLVLIPVFALILIVLLNLPLFHMSYQRQGATFTLLVLPLHVAYYVYSAVTFGCVAVAGLLTRHRLETRRRGAGVAPFDDRQPHLPESGVLAGVDMESGRL